MSIWLNWGFVKSGFQIVSVTIELSSRDIQIDHQIKAFVDIAAN